MQLPQDDANRCIRLLDELDYCALQMLSASKREKLREDDDLRIHLYARKRWQEDGRFIGAYLSSHPEMSAQDAEIIDGWRDRKRKRYLIVDYCDDYAVFFSDTSFFFGVRALTDSFTDLIKQPLPVLVETTLFSYEGKIVWDGLVAVGGGAIDEQIKANILHDYQMAKDKGFVFASAEVLFLDC